MTIKEIRALTGLSQKAFADKYGIPKRSIENWELSDKSESYRECPKYVAELLERVVKFDYEESLINAPIVKKDESI